jgi:ABC-type transporter Mla subunit MlaD
LTQISQIDAAIKASGNETPQQAQQLTAAFSNTATQADLSLAEMNRALQQLAGYISGVQPSLGGLAAQGASIQQGDDKQIAGWRDDLIGKIACGSGTVTDQYAAAQAVLDGAFASFQAPFKAIDSQAGTALHDASQLPGVMLVVQTDSSSFTSELNKAQTYPPANPLRTLHLNNATQDWTTLVTYAQSQLAT